MPGISSGGSDNLTIVPKRRKKKVRTINDLKRGIILFMVFLGLSVVIHETFHLIVARALDYEANAFYGISFFNVYGYVNITPTSKSLIHTLLIFSSGGLGTAAMFFVLWSTIEDIIAKLLLSFFTFMQLSYGGLEPMYGIGIINFESLSIWPIIAGMVGLIIFRIIYWRLGWW